MYLRFPQCLHIELTDKCNAKCPMCQRTDRFGLMATTEVKHVELSFDLIEKQFEGINFKHINYCGNLGDPIVAKDCLKIVEYFSKTGASQTIHTNGSLKTVEWWRKLASISNLQVVFGIDGITEESHQLYRRNTSLQKILENAKAFNMAGGKSVWQMIVFKHNENEIERAKQMSSECGFKAFEILHTRRFHFDDTFSYWWKQKEYVLERPISTPIKKLDSSIESQKFSIDCKAKRDEEIYISADGSVWPCCYIPGRIRRFTIPRDDRRLNIHTSRIVDIVNEVFFDDIEDSFITNPQVACVATCGIGHVNKRQRIINIKPV